MERAGPPLNYSFALRSQASVIQETGQILVRLAALTPGGIVVFFPSYEYLDLLFSRWQSAGLLQQMTEAGKRVFREPKKASEVARILMEYSRANATSKTGSGAARGTGAPSSRSASVAAAGAAPAAVLCASVTGAGNSRENLTESERRTFLSLLFSYLMCSCRSHEQRLSPTVV